MPARKNTADSSVPPPPPADLAARCRATIPVVAEADLRRPRKQPTHRRLLTVTVGAAMAAALAVAELARPSRTPHAVPSPNSGVAFAETIRAMQRVTYFHRSGTGLNVKRVPQWKYLSTRFTNDVWFDARRGLYEQTRGSSGIVSDDATLTLPSDQLYIRFGDEVWIQDHSQRAQWDKIKKSKVREITNPSSFGVGIGARLRPDVAPASPSACRVASWDGERTVCFTLLAPPVKEKIDLQQNAADRAEDHKLWSLMIPKDAPTLRSEVYVNPDTHRVRAVQKYARFPAPSKQPDLLIGEYTYDYDHSPDDALFSPKTILKGADEVRDFRESHRKPDPPIVHSRAKRTQ